MNTYFRSMSEVDRAVPDAETGGFVKIHTKRGTDTIHGATTVARHAQEMINEIGFAMVSAQGPKAIPPLSCPGASIEGRSGRVQSAPPYAVSRKSVFNPTARPPLRGFPALRNGHAPGEGFLGENRGIPGERTIVGKALHGNNQALAKALIFFTLIITALYVVRFSPLRDYFSPYALQGLLDRAGFWAPVAFIVFYAAAICMFVPGTLLTGIGAVIFGPYWGFLYVWTGAMTGSVAAFLVSRTLGRDFAAGLAGQKLKKYDEAIERNGFATVLYLRLVYVPFTIANFGMGLTRVRFRDYFFGTALGILTGTFIFTFFFGTLKEIWVSGDWSRLLSVQVFLSVGLLVLSILIPMGLKKIKGER